MFDLRKIFDLRKFFVVPKNYLKSKIHCINFVLYSNYVNVWRLTQNNMIHSQNNFCSSKNKLHIMFTVFLLATLPWFSKTWYTLFIHTSFIKINIFSVFCGRHVIRKGICYVSNWRILEYSRNLSPFFFQNKQNWDSHTGQRQLISDFKFLTSRFFK